MLAPLRSVAGLVAAFLPMTSMACASDMPSRAPGLWVVTSEDNPHANWSMCVDDSKSDFVDTDVWKNFGKECKVTAFQKDGSKHSLDAACDLGDGTQAKMQLSFSGDFRRSYRFQSVTSFAVGNEAMSQTVMAEAVFAGQCPAELKPGMKKMQRTGLILGK